MDNKISVLIVDDNVEFCDLLRQYINKCGSLNCIGTANDGEEGIELIKFHSPDVVILDIVMPNLDGIDVLENIKNSNLKKKPVFIVLSAVGQDSYTRKSMELGAEYYMVKPFNIEVLLTRIMELYRDKDAKCFVASRPSQMKVDFDNNPHMKTHDVEIDVSMIMHDAGIPTHLSGYRYLREAITITIRSPYVFNSITKVLYPAIAEKFNSTPQKVERSIRNAIESAWVKESNKLVKIFYDRSGDCCNNKPTNSQFIAAAAEKIRMMRGLQF